MSKRLVFPTLIFILLLGGFFRFYLLQEIPPGLYPDEAMNGNNALEALTTGSFKIFYPENNGREGLFINLQAISLWLFGKEPWALRVVSAVFGTLTILGMYFLTLELLRLKSDFNHERSSTSIALLSSFFLASSYWHINFSRIGFRAILVPFFAAFGLYFLLKGLREGKILPLVWAGVFIGLGFHTYIAFRFMPFVLAGPLIWYLWRWWRSTPNSPNYCAPCAVLLFLFITFVVALPIGYYFLQNPQDFVGRAGDVSIFSAQNPSWEFVKSNVKILGMFLAPGAGDCNWRHNFDCQPFLLTGLLGLAGALGLWRTASFRALLFLVSWAFFMSLPATLTREGMPHALRSIGMIPPLVILEATGAWYLLQVVFGWLEKQEIKWGEYRGQFRRIKKEAVILFLSLLLVVTFQSHRQYFIRWANSPLTYFAFSTDMWHLGRYLNGLPLEIKKYVVVNLPGVYVRGIPAAAQTVMFATDTFREEEKTRKNIQYILAENANQLSPVGNQKVVIAFLNSDDRELRQVYSRKFPEFRVHAPLDFVVFTNY